MQSANGITGSLEWPIRPDRVRMISTGAAGRNIKLARLVGEAPTFDASWLEALYYRQRGRCAISGLHMTDPHENTLLSMQLDHIVPVGKNQQIESAVSGDPSCANSGRFASRDNVRWVCRAAHSLRHNIEHYGLDLFEFCRMVCLILDNGCEVDVWTADKIKGEKAFADSAKSAISEATCNGTKFASFDEIHSLLHSRGIQITKTNARRAMIDVVGPINRFAQRLRLDVVKQLIADDQSVCDRILSGDFHNVFFRCNERLSAAGIPCVSVQQLRQDLRSLGVNPARKAGRGLSQRNRSSITGDVRSRLWSWAKNKGVGGFSIEEAGKFLATNETHLAMAIRDGVCRRLLDREGERFFGRLNRKEAAMFVDLSPQVLKKYAVTGKGPPYEAGKPGSGIETTYSFFDLLQWRQINPPRAPKQQAELSFS